MDECSRARKPFAVSRASQFWQVAIFSVGFPPSRHGQSGPPITRQKMFRPRAKVSPFIVHQRADEPFSGEHHRREFGSAASDELRAISWRRKARPSRKRSISIGQSIRIRTTRALLALCFTCSMKISRIRSMWRESLESRAWPITEFSGFSPVLQRRAWSREFHSRTDTQRNRMEFRTADLARNFSFPQ